MKATDFLREYKYVEMELQNGEEIPVYVNPSAKELRLLLDKYKELRGTLTDTKLFVWDAFEASHGSFLISFGDVIGYLYFAKKGDMIGSPTWNGEMIDYKDIQYGIYSDMDTKQAPNHMLLKRALG